MFSKRAVLCGEDSRAHIFRSDTVLGGPDGMSRLSHNLPTAVVETMDTKKEGRTHARPAFLLSFLIRETISRQTVR
jgi:hypothetical protein